MPSAFITEAAPYALSFDIDHNFAEPAHFCWSCRQHFKFPLSGFGVFAVHAQQISDEQRRLISACACANFDQNRIDRTVLAHYEQALDIFHGVGGLVFQTVEFGRRELFQVAICVGIIYNPLCFVAIGAYFHILAVRFNDSGQ